MSGAPSLHLRPHRPWMVLTWLMLVALLFSACGAEEPKVYRVGILSGLDFFANTADGFKAKMTELGYIEGQNIVYDMQKTNSDPNAAKAIINRFVADKVDLIFVFPTDVALAAKAATQGTNIPVLFANANIEGLNLVQSVREPGANITGVRYPGPDLAVKRFEILHGLVPEAKRFWVPYKRNVPIVPSQLEVLRPAAASVNVTLVEAPVNDAAEIAANLKDHALSPDIGIDAILMIAEPLVVTPDGFSAMAEFATEHHLPIGGALMVVGDYASLFGVSTDNVAVGRQAATLADQILKGTPAGSLPVLSAESYLQLNYNAAQKFGLTLPDGLLNQADQVIH